ncbi:hypothetical protein ABPG72_014041 [Tetrahymena utriculariae]
MRIQQIGIQAKAKTITKQILHTQSVTRKIQVDKILDPIPQIQVENQQTSAHFMNDDIHKTLETINQLKNYCSSSLKDLEIQQKVTLTSDNSSVQDIKLVKPGKQGMKRSMKKNLKKRTMQKIIIPNLIDIGQVFMDLLLFQHDYIEKKKIHATTIDNQLKQSQSIFLQQQAVDKELTKRQKQKQEIMIKIKKTIEQLSKSHSQLATKEFSNAVRLTLGKNEFMLCQRQKEQQAEKCLKQANFYEKQSALQVNQFGFSKLKFQGKQDLNQQLILEEGHISSTCNASDINSSNQGQQHDCYQQIIEKVSEQEITLGQQIRSYQYSNSQEEQQENNQNIKENQIQQTLKEEAQYQNQLQSDQVEQCFKTEQGYQLLDYFESSAEFIYHNNSGQKKELRADHVNIEHLLQQLTCSNNLKLTSIKIQIVDQQISIDLTQSQRNNLLNLIKQKKKSQIRRLITTVIFKQHYLLKQGNLLLNKLIFQDVKPKFKEHKKNLIEESHLGQHFDSQQTQPQKQIQRLKQQISVYDASCSKIFNGHKLLGGGCGRSIISIANPQEHLKKDEQQKLKNDEFFKESQYLDESKYSDFMDIYDKYYTKNETNPKLLENLIRTIVNALHGQCENIIHLEIRPKVIELINLLINYYMIVIQNNEVKAIQKFIDQTAQQLKDLKETCFQIRKTYPCLDLYQYFDFLICLNYQRQGIDKINKGKAFEIAEIILKIVKFGAGFTSIFGMINTLSTINIQGIYEDFQKIKQLCANLFEASQKTGEQAFNYYTSYSSGTLSNKIQAIWLRKIDSLGNKLRDDQQEIIFYLQQREEVENQGNDEIILFVYMQLNYLLQKNQKEDNLNQLSKLLKDTKQENLIIDFINYLQFKTYSNTLFENAKKLLNTMVTSEQFRQLKISLLLKFSQILEQFSDKKQEYHKLMIYLCMTYLQENEISVKIVFKGNQKMKLFIDDIEKYTVEIVNESKQSYQTMKTMIQNEKELNKIANIIESKEDVVLLLAKTYVQMWEASVKQRQESNKITHKDDVLLEVIQLYIKQKVSYLGGYSFFEDLDNKNKEEQTEINDALKLIIDKFLIPNFVQPREKQLELNQIAIQNLKCTKHSNKNVQFIQFNDIINQSDSNKPLFYCSSCFNHDLRFKSINYLMIDQILQEADKTIIPKWPPVNNFQIISDLINFTSNQSQFDYLLSNQQANSLLEHSSLCKQFIEKSESQKDKNTELLQNLLTQANQLQSNFNLEYPNNIKQQLFTFIDQISFFNEDIAQVRSNQSNSNIQLANISNQNMNSEFKLTSELIFKLISNKSNFCSDEFINELNQSLQNLNPLLQCYRFHTIFKENKEPIDFSKISEQRLNLIENYVKHSINLASDNQYENEVKNSLEIKQMNQIMNSKMSFLKNELIQEFEKFFVDVKPFLKQINFTNSIIDQNKFDFFRNLSDENLNDLFQMAKKRLFYFSQKLFVTKLNNQQNNCLVKKNENADYEIQKLNGNRNIYVNCISSINLQKDLKYVFRVQIESFKEDDQLMIGLMRNANADSIVGYDEMLSCYLNNINQSIIKCANYGIYKDLKGNQFKISRDKMIEMRVYLKEQILEVVDYPNYEYKLGLEDQYKQKLTQYDDLRFYAGLFNGGTKIVLRDAEIVNEFRN